MPSTHTLTDTAIRKASPGEKPRKLADGSGLYLEIQPSGARYWRLKYRIGGKEKRLSLGVYPAVTLADARKRRDEARALVAAGIDPSENRKASKADQVRQRETQALIDAGAPLPGSFEAVARDWLQLVHEPKVSARYALRSRIQLERDVFPHIGRRPAREVDAPTVLDLVRRVAGRDALDTAHRVKQTIGLVMRHAIATGHADRDPTPDLRNALPQPITRHFSAILDPVRVGELLRAVDAYTGQPGTRAALQLAALTFQRPGNVRAMQWAHLDLDGGTWSIPAAEMKRSKQDKETGAPHLVPLATQAVVILQELQPLTGGGPLVFPGLRSRSRPISDVTLNAALRRLGFGPDEMTGHGFRAMARTVMIENLPGIDPEWIEAQLAHGKRGALRGAYDRAQYLAQRRKMMQTWADYLDRLRAGAQVLPFRTA
ncbi:MAG TPA: integrase arm-type DNA-binding domain-containing protein [Burkholderiaceae bacterium]|nr:integrase arm-type DNA-binding domain-containing protein [Burkholderiaceae bacterium]HMX09441.1 integrase arm-type DNA-binding domain-containing protein [Burkholderiaceae bacterium]HMY99068.1 integrase arm-type DNA-binding domain-containing protein [Burkholderiaceae bacterium]HNB43379.1 integrase arm-type DNA-binding domain-containing protein [Burkholderiaceae bacterium]HNG77928.1 integrase arm-type DNA-binding domain-containing protein [Burkholderiaceae bacterium]